MTERDQQLISFYLENNTLQECGDRFKITRERVRQILNANGVKPRSATPPIRETLSNRRDKLTRVERFWLTVDKSGGDGACWLWTGYAHPINGYGIFSARGYTKKRYAHQLAYLFGFRRAIKNSVLHKCDVRLCCNPKHLYDGTQQDNVRDRNTRGREQWLKALRAKAVFNETSIFNIRKRLAEGEKGAAIAKDYKTSAAYISMINTGKVWKHVSVPAGEKALAIQS